MRDQIATLEDYLQREEADTIGLNNLYRPKCAREHSPAVWLVNPPGFYWHIEERRLYLGNRPYPAHTPLGAMQGS